MKGLTQMDFDSAITKSFHMPKFPGATGYKPPRVKPIKFSPRTTKGFKMPGIPQPPSTSYPFLKTNNVDRMGKL